MERVVDATSDDDGDQQREKQLDSPTTIAAYGKTFSNFNRPQGRRKRAGVNANREIYRLLKNGVKVAFRVQNGEEAFETVSCTRKGARRATGPFLRSARKGLSSFDLGPKSRDAIGR